MEDSTRTTLLNTLRHYLTLHGCNGSQTRTRGIFHIRPNNTVTVGGTYAGYTVVAYPSATDIRPTTIILDPTHHLAGHLELPRFRASELEGKRSGRRRGVGKRRPGIDGVW